MGWRREKTGWEFRNSTILTVRQRGSSKCTPIRVDRKGRRSGKSAPLRCCPTALQVVDVLWWGRRFRLPIRSFEEFFRSLVPHATHGGSWSGSSRHA